MRRRDSGAGLYGTMKYLLRMRVAPCPQDVRVDIINFKAWTFATNKPMLAA